MCLLCGTNWIFESYGYSFFLKVLWQTLRGLSTPTSTVELRVA